MKTDDFDGHMRMCYFQIKLIGEEGNQSNAFDPIGMKHAYFSFQCNFLYCIPLLKSTK